MASALSDLRLYGSARLLAASTTFRKRYVS